MRTNIEIDDALMAQALAAGPYKTKKEAVEAGLRLVARQAAYREILKWRGKLRWEGDPSIDWTRPADEAVEPSPPLVAAEPGAPGYRAAPATAGDDAGRSSSRPAATATATATARNRRARR